MKFLKTRIFGFVILASISSLSWGWAGVTTGSVQTIQVAAGENYGFRVYLKNGPALCGNANDWAYLNESDSNYKTYVSVLLAAKMAGVSVTVYTEKETTSGTGYCHIGYISMS